MMGVWVCKHGSLGHKCEICQRDDDIEEVRAENTRLRAALAHSDQPCVYCTLPAEDWGKCARGFPGCARGDDAAGCPELGAAMTLHDLRDELLEAMQLAVDELAFVRIRRGNAGYNSGYLDGRANGAKSTMMAAQKIVRDILDGCA